MRSMVDFTHTHHSTNRTKSRRAVWRGRPWSLGRRIASIRWAHRPPHGRRLHRFGIASREKNVQLMGGQRLGCRMGRGGPPAESPGGKTLVTKAKPLTVVHQRLQCGSWPVAEHEHPSANPTRAGHLHGRSPQRLGDARENLTSPPPMLESPPDAVHPRGEDARLPATPGLSSTSSSADNPRYHAAQNASHTPTGRARYFFNSNPSCTPSSSLLISSM